MARVFDDRHKLIGYLDDPRCRGPLEPGTLHVDFPAWRQDDYAPWQHTDPGPSGAAQPYQRRSLTHMIFQIQVTNIAEPEIDLLLRHDEVNFMKAHHLFKAA